MILLVSGIEAYVFTFLVIVAMISIGGLFFMFLKTDDRQSERADGRPDERGS